MRTRGEEEEAEIGNKYLCFPPLSLPFRHPCADRIAIPSSPFGSFGSPLQSHASKSTEKKTPPLQKKHPTTVRADDSPLDARRRRRHRLCPRRGARASVPCPGVPRLRGRVQGRPVRHGHGEQIDEGRERKRERKRRADLSLLSLLSSWLSVPFSSTSTSSPLSQKKKKKTLPTNSTKRPPSSPPSAPPSPSTATTPRVRPPSPPSARRPTRGSPNTAATTSSAASRRTGERGRFFFLLFFFGALFCVLCAPQRE